MGIGQCNLPDIRADSNGMWLLERHGDSFYVGGPAGFAGAVAPWDAHMRRELGRAVEGSCSPT